jgi:hypothetical protein
MTEAKKIHRTLYTARADYPDGTRLNETITLETSMSEQPPTPAATFTVYGPGGAVIARATTAKTQTARVY